jgi:hypothetical protein
MMEASEDRGRYDPADALDRPIRGSVFAERQMAADLILVGYRCPQDSPQVDVSEHDHLVEDSRRIELMSFSKHPFCHGDRGAVGRSRMPGALTRQ